MESDFSKTASIGAALQVHLMILKALRQFFPLKLSGFQRARHLLWSESVAEDRNPKREPLLYPSWQIDS